MRQEVPVTKRHMAEGSSMYLRPGERVTVETLLYGLLLCSGNDAALAIADAGRLVVETAAGRRTALSHAEVSVKPARP